MLGYVLYFIMSIYEENGKYVHPKGLMFFEESSRATSKIRVIAKNAACFTVLLGKNSQYAHTKLKWISRLYYLYLFLKYPLFYL